MIRIAVGTEANTVHDTHCTDVMDTKATQAVVQRYIPIGLIDIKSNHKQTKEKLKKKIRSHEAHPEKHRNKTYSFLLRNSKKKIK